MENINLKLLTIDELVNIEGGLEPVESIIAVGAALYGAGFAIGVFLHHALN